MNQFWLGVLAVPAALIAMTITLIITKRLLTIAGDAGAKIVRLLPDAAESTRAAFGAVAYSADRCWFLAFGDMGIAVFAGQNGRDRLAAAHRLEQRAEVRKIVFGEIEDDEEA